MMVYDVVIDGRTFRVELEQRDGRWACRLDGRDFPVDAVLPRENVLSLLIGGRSFEVKRERAGGDLHLWVKTSRYAAEVRDPRSLTTRRAASAAAAGPRKLVAPMPGKVVRVLVAESAEVELGQGLLIIEAMKMQNEIKSPKKGMVRQVMAREGAAVTAGEVLVVVE